MAPIFINQLTKMCMTNVSKNPNWKKEFDDHLTSNGFAASPGNENSQPYFFFKEDLAIMVSDDSITCVDYKLPKASQIVAMYSGIGRLDLHGWMLLMHIAGMVPLTEIAIRVPHECVTLARYDNKDLVGNIKRAFDPHNNTILTVH